MKIDPVLITMMRKTMPRLRATDIVGVQPMTEPAVGLFKMKYTSKEDSEYWNYFGDTIHNFLYGYMVWIGDDYIIIDEFVELYGKERILDYTKSEYNHDYEGKY